MIQTAVKRLRAIGGQLTDQLDTRQLAEATSATDAFTHPLSPEDIRALLLLLPDGGDTASGVNWTILHAIEASPAWPVWDTLERADNEWIAIFEARLANAGLHPPD